MFRSNNKSYNIEGKVRSLNKIIEERRGEEMRRGGEEERRRGGEEKRRRGEEEERRGGGEEVIKKI